MIIASSVCKAFGQEIKTDLLGSDKDTETLIEEFRAIMEIPEESRTVDQWNRSIEIIFTIYHGADLTLLFRELESELREQARLKQELDNLLNKLYKHIEAEKELTEHLTELQERYKLISKELESTHLGFSFYPFVKGGFTSGIGFNVGLGFIIPITDHLIIGADTLWHIHTKNLTKYFSFDFLIGWGF